MYIICFILRHFYLALVALRCFFDVRDFLKRLLPPAWGAGACAIACGSSTGFTISGFATTGGWEGSGSFGFLGYPKILLPNQEFPVVEVDDDQGAHEENIPPPFLTVRLLDLDFDACTFLLFGDICVNIYMMA